ncbi:hypothetical protein K9L63_01785 [Candidatus Gracilibacteria bacterium]|nr:hypothetical protein [Candidatus Gracilibacteria bacterium]
MNYPTNTLTPPEAHTVADTPTLPTAITQELLDEEIRHQLTLLHKIIGPPSPSVWNTAVQRAKINLNLARSCARAAEQERWETEGM